MRQPVVGQHIRRRPAAAVVGILARPAHLPARGRRAARGAARRTTPASMSTPRFTTSSRSSSVARRRVAQHERLGAEHRAVDRCPRPVRGTPRRCGAARADRDAAARCVAVRSRSSQSSLQRSNVSAIVRHRQPRLHFARRRGSGTADELGASLLHRRGELRLVIGEVEERRWSRRTPVPGTASACPAQQQQRRHRAVAARATSAAESREPSPELAT